MNKPEFVDEDQLDEYLEYLDSLRESGETNMFGAGRWLENAFDLSRPEAREVLSYWMESFNVNILMKLKWRFINFLINLIKGVNYARNRIGSNYWFYHGVRW